MIANVIRFKSFRFFSSFRGMGLILCLSTVSTSGLIVQPQVVTAQMLTQSTAPSSTLDCLAERQQYEIREINTALEQAEQAALNGRTEQSSQLLIQTLRRIQAMENSSAKIDLLQRLVGSMSEGFAYTSMLERLVQAVPAQRPEAALAVLTPALEVTRGLSSSYSAAKTQIFVVLANYYTHLGQPEQSSRILAEALSASDAIQGSEFKTSALSDIAAAYINAKQTDKALPILERSLQYARTIDKPNSYQQAAKLERIANLYAQIGQPDQALQAVRLIKVPSYSSNALLLVVDKYSEAGQVDQALGALSSIGQPEQKALALAIMAGRLTAAQPQRSGQLYAEAVATAQSVQNANSVMVDVALRYAATGGLVATADETIQKVNDRSVQALALGEIALLYAQAGQEDRAEVRLAQAIETLAAIPEEGNRNSARQRLLEQAAQRGRYDYASQVAATIQPGEEAPFDRVDVLTGLADQALTEERYDAALQIAEQIPPSFASWRDRLFPEIARGFVQSGQLDRALMIAQQENPNPGFRPRILAAIAAQLAKVGQSQQAAAMFNQATLLANAIDDAYARAEVLGAIAQAYLEAGQTESATQLLNQTIATAQTIEDASNRSYILRTIAEQLTFAGYYQAAIEIAEAISADSERLTKLNEALEKAIATEDLATVLKAVGQAENPVLKTRWLIAVADRYSQMRKIRESTESLNQAFEAARTIPGDESKTVVMQGGEGSLIVEDDQDRGSFLAEIALRYAQMDQASQAQQVAQKLNSPTLQRQLMNQISCYL